MWHRKTVSIGWILLLVAALTLSGCKQATDEGDGEKTEEGENAESGKKGDENAEKGNEEAEETGEESGDDEADETAAAEDVDDAADAAGEFDPSTLTVLTLLPKETPMVVFTPNIQQTADDLGRSYFIDKFQPQYNELVAQMKEDIGYNLLDPKEVSELGVKPDGAAGFAALDIDKEVFGFFIEVSDAAKLEKTLAEFIEKEEKKVEREEVGDFVMLSGEKKNGVILLGKGWAILIGSDTDGAALAMAKATAERDPANSLAQNEKFANSVKNLRHTKHLVGYVASTALQSLAQRSDMERIQSLENQVAELKKAGADASQIKVLEQEVAMRKAELEEQAKNLRMVFGKVDGIGLGVDASGQTFGVELDILADKEGISTVLANAKTTPTIISASTEAPLALVSFNVVPEGVYDAFGQVIKAQGGDMAMVDQAVKAITGMDLKADIVGNLTGEIGVMVDGDLAEIENPSDFTGGAILGVKDPKKAIEMLDKLASIPQAGDNITKDGDVFKIKSPEIGEIHVQVAGNFITVSNDAGFAERVSSDANKSFVSGLDHEALKKALDSSESAALIVFEPKLLGMLFLAGDMDMGMSVPDMPSDASADLKKKYDELQKINAKIDELRKAERKKRNSTMLEAFEPLGTSAMFLRVTDTGIELEAGQFMNAEGMPELIDALIQSAMGIEAEGGMGPGSDDLANLYSQRWELEDAIFNEVMGGGEEPMPEKPKEVSPKKAQ